MVNDILDGYVFLNEDLILNLDPRCFSKYMIQEVFPEDTLYVCYDMEEAESVLEDCKNRFAKEMYVGGFDPDELQSLLSGITPVPVRYLLERDIIARMKLVLVGFYYMDED